MKTILRIGRYGAAIVPLALLVLLLILPLNANDRDFRLQGTFIEGMNCKDQSPATLTTFSNGCQGIGVLSLTGGKYLNVDLKDAKIAYAVSAGDWVRIYVDAQNPVQREAAITFARDFLAPYGRIDTAREARIQITGTNGNYTAMVDNGNILQLTTQPILGGDNQHPVVIDNSKSKLSNKLYQGLAVQGSVKDGNRQFDLRNGVAFFNNDLDSKGTL